MFKKSGNLKVEELTRSCKKRSYLLSDLKPIKLDGVHKNCIWCLSLLTGNRNKWCSDECIDYALAWARPQCEQGLHVLLVRQDFKCLQCGYSYLEYVQQALNQLNKWQQNVDPATIKTKISFLLMRCFRGLLPREYRAEVDHVLAISLGGTSLGLENHRVLCSRCHKTKTKSDIKEKFAKNGNPRKGVKFTESHVGALSKVRKGFDSSNRKAHREIMYAEMRKPIIAINLATKEEIQFDSSISAAKALNLQESNISRVLKGKQNRKQHKGWTFRYI
jgi:5-methylcytosine-specific restriction endonuclease McrA